MANDGPQRTPKRIVVFADGTGNAFTTQESNVWRIYQALDGATRDQIAFYIPGVGTSSFKPFALLDGATGVGVPANVRKLHRFISWNWEPGDDIYLFGFSRGAFTIRTLIDLIDKEGLLPVAIGGEPVGHAEMERNSKAAWRAYCRKDPVRKRNIWVKLGVRALRDALLHLWGVLRRHRDYREVERAAHERRVVPIAFAGLFDTVNAYGVPFEELRTAIDRFLWPIAFGDDLTLSERVARVRHALSLDDERTTFHPIRIDSRGEDPAKKRIEEVWFAGVHSDVGGGYPDASLSHTPLVWMLEEALDAATRADAVLRLQPDALDEFRHAASAFGPLHDSRSGAGVLYRYAPRVIDDNSGRFGKVSVHYAVAERMVFGSDNYAPIGLPSDAEILLPDRSRFSPADARRTAAAQVNFADREDVDAALEAAEKLQPPDQTFIDRALDLVWRRRVYYFVMVGTLALLALFPIVGDALENVLDRVGKLFDPDIAAKIDNVASGLTNLFRSVVDFVKSVTPAYVGPYLQSYRHHPLISGALFALFAATYVASGGLRDRIKDYARRAWTFEGRLINAQKIEREAQRGSALDFVARKMRTNRVSGAVHNLFAEWVFPIAWLIVLGALLLPPLVGSASRAFFDYQAGAGNICYGTTDPRKYPEGSPERANPPRLVTAKLDEPVSKKGWSSESAERIRENGFRTSDPCWASGFGVEEGAAYRLFIEIDTQSAKDQPWFDQTIMTDVGGFKSDTLWRKLALDPFLRWPSAGWFHPIARIGDKGDAEWPLVSLDETGPLGGAQDEKCTRLPIRYDKTQDRRNFCDTAKPTPKTCREAPLRLAWDAQLPDDELSAANAAWERDVFPSGKNGAECASAFPRKRFVSDFVAKKTGELFLFVNDAVVFPLGGGPQAFYKNNRGTATITLERFPLPPAPRAE